MEDEAMPESSAAPAPKKSRPKPRPDSTFKRTAARVAAVQVLYQRDILGEDADIPTMVAEAAEELVSITTHMEPKERWVKVPPDATMLRDLVSGVLSTVEQLDEALEPCLTDEWKIDRLSAIVRCMLYAASFELLMLKKAPPKVVINEYVTLAHAFANEPEAAFVNGVLDALVKKSGL